MGLKMEGHGANISSVLVKILRILLSYRLAVAGLCLKEDNNTS